MVEAENWKVSAYDGFTERNPRYRLDLLWIWCAAFAIGCQQGLDDPRVLYLCMSSRIFYYQNQSVVQTACKEFSFSHVRAKQDQECGGKVCRNTKGSASCFCQVKAKQGIRILFLSRQSKARPRQAVIAKWQTKQWTRRGKSVQGRDQRKKFSAVSRGSQGSKASRSARPHGTASPAQTPRARAAPQTHTTRESPQPIPRKRPLLRPADPDQEWRGTAPGALSQEYRRNTQPGPSARSGEGPPTTTSSGPPQARSGREPQQGPAARSG